MIETNAVAPSARRRQVIEFLDLRKGDIDLRGPRLASCAEQRRQPVERLRPEHEIDVRRTPHDRRAFLRRDAAADADQHVRSRRLERAHAAEVMEHALLRLLAYRARVEQDDVRVVGTIGPHQPLGGSEHVGHAVRIVLVHLTAERADEELARHLRCFEKGRDYIKRL